MSTVLPFFSLPFLLLLALVVTAPQTDPVVVQERDDPSQHTPERNVDFSVTQAPGQRDCVRTMYDVMLRYPGHLSTAILYNVTITTGNATRRSRTVIFT